MGDRVDVGDLLRQWWRQRDDYHWRVEFLRSRGLLSILRYVIAGIGATMGVLSVVNIFLTPGGQGTLFRIGWAVVALGSLGWAARWALFPWPSVRASAAMVVLVDILMTLSALLFGDPALAMSGIPILLCAGGYVVFFHGPRLHLAHIIWCTVSVGGIAVWLAVSTPENGLQVALTRAIIALLVTVCILPALQFGFWLLQDSSMQSLTDPLTELTNRRGLALAVKRLNAAALDHTDLCVLVIDVDGFKAINDTHGHAIGDDVLMRTARRIRSTVVDDAVVVRWGGEEFLVVERMMAEHAETLAERICGAVSAVADPSVTVSIGVACAPADTALDDAIAAADAAMYEAKARGGNCVVVTTEVR
ncbi:diguanylate cyclase [Mycobacterium sp. pV006]|uniref:GGDEF domain-containing protein n=1 Tax=Mycobacterium sp. pV006 TaxID=3238983 RepID=UPI00351B8A39